MSEETTKPPPPPPEGEQQPQQEEMKPTFKLELLEDVLMITMSDQHGYLVTVDGVALDTVIRFNYNAITGELTLVISETSGGIGDKLVDTIDSTGAKTGERYAIRGSITGYQIIIGDQDIIQKVLMKYLNIPFPKKFNEVFPAMESFIANTKRRQAAYEQKLKEEAAKPKATQKTKKEGRIVDMHNNPISD